MRACAKKPPALFGGALVVAVPCLFVAACGSGAGGWRGVSASISGGGSGSAGRPTSGVQGRSPYRWLARTQGAPPSIAAENREAGTTAWRLPGPPSLLGGAARGRVEGYVAEQAIAPGETERVY